MDLFNRKKVAALQSDLALVTAQLKATTKELDDLQTDIVKSYNELTEYFHPRYKNKYFKVELTPEQDEVSCAETPNETLIISPTIHLYRFIFLFYFYFPFSSFDHSNANFIQ